MALPQVVGLVQEAFRGQQERTVDQKQRFHHDLAAAEHDLIHPPCLLRNILVQDIGDDCSKQLYNLFHNKPPGHSFRVLVQENS